MVSNQKGSGLISNVLKTTKAHQLFKGDLHSLFERREYELK
jgi:hypothetical protein